jgi:hypothetical protein
MFGGNTIKTQHVRLFDIIISLFFSCGACSSPVFGLQHQIKSNKNKLNQTKHLVIQAHRE